MNSTNVPSNNNTEIIYNPDMNGLQMIIKIKEKELSAPKKAAKVGNSHNDVKRYGEIGEIVISPVGNCRLTSKDQLVGDNGDIIVANMQKGAYGRVENAGKKRNRYQGIENQEVR